MGAVEGDVRPDELGELLGDEATLADAVALWNALENPWEMVEEYRAERREEEGR